MRGGEGLEKKMEELRLLTEREIQIQHSKIHSSLSQSFLSSKSNAHQSLLIRGDIRDKSVIISSGYCFFVPIFIPGDIRDESVIISSGTRVVAITKLSKNEIQVKAQQILLNPENIGKLKVELREVEDDLVKALAAKTRKEAERMRAMDCISATRTRIEELKRIVEDQKARKSEFAAIMARQYEALSACEQSSNKNKRDVREIEEAMSWYNKILGFRLESGHGVKFIFTNIGSKNPSAEYYFSVRHENDLYTLLECEPPLKDIKEAVQELNKSNGLFAFARTMREKFQEATLHGNFPRTTYRDQVTSTICLSAPASSVSSENKSESNLSVSMIRPEETSRSSKKSNHGIVGKEALLSPGSVSLHRRSPRFKVKN